MFNAPAGNSDFDVPFLVIEGLGIVFWIVAIAKPGRFSAALLRWVAVLVVVAVPAFWQIAFPSRSGMEGAGRLIMAVPLIAMNILMAFAAYLRGKKSGG